MGAVLGVRGLNYRADADETTRVEAYQQYKFLDLDARAAYEWQLADSDESGTVSFGEAKAMVFRLNAAVSKKVLKKTFDAFDADGNGELDYDEFTKFFRAISSRPDTDDVFKHYFGEETEFITATELERFVRSCQKDDASTTEDLENLINMYDSISRKADAPIPSNGFRKKNLCCGSSLVKQERELAHARSVWTMGTAMSEVRESDEEQRPQNSFTKDGFLRFLADPVRNSVVDFDKIHHVNEQDMRRPLSHYYINSSHNTYLEGNQMTGSSTPAAVARALRLGVRVIELDVWDGENGEPVVKHGHTMTSSIAFQACIDAVHENAFLSSEYPVILTLENHCNPKQQDRIATILESTLGEQLYRFFKPGMDLYTGPSEWATPYDLRKKVVIRDKPKRKGHKAQAQKINASSNNSSSGPQDDDDDDDDDEDLFNEETTEEGIGHIIGDFKRAKDELKANFLTELESVGAKMGMNVEQLEEKHPWIVDSKNLMKESVKGLLEVVYVKNVKLRVHAGKAAKRTVPRRKSAAADLGKTSDVSAMLESMDSQGSVDTVSSGESATSSAMKAARRGSMRGMASNVKNKMYPPEAYSAVVFKEPPFRSSSSIDEKKLEKLAQPGPLVAALSTYTNRHLVRSYPKGFGRVDSSNYDPTLAWRAGVQIAALNMQTNSKPVWINQGLFAFNGGCGYVLKPRRMLEALSCGRVDAADDEKPSENPLGKYWDLIHLPFVDQINVLEVTVLSGHNLPKPAGVDPDKHEVIDPYVELSMHGFNVSSKMFKTKIVHDNGFDPRWNQKFELKFSDPELSHLLFVVRDHELLGSDDFLGQFSVPVNQIRTGYRCVPLNHADSTRVSEAFLFCRFDVIHG